MNKENTAAGSGRMWWIAAGAAGLLAFGGVMTLRAPTPEQTAQTDTAPQTQPQAPAAATPDAKPAPAAKPQANAEPQAKAQDEASPEPVAPIVIPSIDEVRLEDDGLVVIAGRGAVGAQIAVLLDQVEIASAIVDDSGAFAAIAFLEPSADPRVLSIRQTHAGAQQLSAADVILAPLDVAPTDVATADAASTKAATGDVSPSDLAQAEAAPATPVQETPAPKADQTPAAPAPVPMPAPVETAQVAPAAPAAQPQSQGTQTQAAAAPQNAPTEAAQDMTASADADDDTAADKPEKDKPAQTENAATLPDAGVQTTASSDPAEPQPSASGQSQSTVSDAGQSSPSQAAPSQAEPAQTEARAPRVAVLKSSETGVELLQDDAAVQVITLDTIGYSEAGDVRLTGRAQAGTGQVRLYLDNALVQTLAVQDGGRWRGILPNIAPGDYMLRVDAVDAVGKMLSRIETPLRRESPQVLAEASAKTNKPIEAITVQKGHTLWAIARARYGDGLLYVKVFEANKNAIRDPDLIYPGQVFDLPD